MLKDLARDKSNSNEQIPMYKFGKKNRYKPIILNTNRNIVIQQ